MAKNKFYNFITGESKNELYVYGEIISGADKWDETDVTFEDFRSTLDNISDGSQLDMYINSPGGSVFATQSIVAMLRRAKERNITINAYIDGIGASCSSWLPMIADNVYVYPQSILMIHKPMTLAMGNATEMKKEISILDKIEDDIIIPLYMEKTKDNVTTETIKDMMEKETWFNASEISNIFNVTLLPESRQIACCVDKNVFNRYSNIPKELLNQLSNQEGKEGDKVKDEDIKDEEEEVIEEVIEETVESKDDAVVETVETPKGEEVVESEDNKDTEIQDLNSKIETLTNEKLELENKLKEANDKILSLDDKIDELQPIVDKYNVEIEKQIKANEEKLVNEKTEYYKNKFNKLGAKSKFESEEVQNLLKNCAKDEKAIDSLNKMIVDLVSIEDKIPTLKVESVSKIENLIPIEDSIAEKFGFR